MPKLNKDTERVDLTLPIGMKARAKACGINMSFHATKAIGKAIEVQEKANEE
jgi:post-segregation antitoxin (ccd killing protein)